MRQIGDPFEIRLTRREREVLYLLARGYASGDIAKALGWSVRTVGNYLDILKNKLEVWTRPGLVAKAVEFGMCPCREVDIVIVPKERRP